jgi:hypothetical protein
VTKFWVSRAGVAKMMLFWVNMRSKLLSTQLIFLLLFYLTQQDENPKNCFGFSHHGGCNCSYTSEEPDAMTFRVTEYAYLHAFNKTQGTHSSWHLDKHVICSVI